MKCPPISCLNIFNCLSPTSETRNNTSPPSSPTTSPQVPPSASPQTILAKNSRGNVIRRMSTGSDDIDPTKQKDKQKQVDTNLLHQQNEQPTTPVATSSSSILPDEVTLPPSSSATQQPEESVQQATQPPFQLARLPGDLVHEVGNHLPPDDLFNLIRVNKRFRGFLMPHEQKIVKAALLTSKKATFSTDGNIVNRQGGRIPCHPDHFNLTLGFIRGMGPAHQEKPLQELRSQATTEAQIGAIFDQLDNLGKLPPFLLPKNFESLSEESKRAVRIFSWQLLVQNMLAATFRQQKWLDAYAELMGAIDGAAFPKEKIDRLLDDDLSSVLKAFGAPDPTDLVAGRDWLHAQANESKLKLTPKIYGCFSQNARSCLEESLDLSPNAEGVMHRGYDVMHGTVEIDPIYGLELSSDDEDDDLDERRIGQRYRRTFSQ